jgi:hypothetical protein
MSGVHQVVFDRLDTVLATLGTSRSSTRSPYAQGGCLGPKRGSNREGDRANR